MFFSWTVPNSYLNSSVYPEYPQKWSMLSEPILDKSLYVSYNETKAYGNYHTGTILNLTQNSYLDILATNKTSRFSLTLLNPTSDDINITIDLYNNITSLSEYEGGNNYIGTVIATNIYRYNFLVSPLSSRHFTYNNPGCCSTNNWDCSIGGKIASFNAGSNTIYVSGGPGRITISNPITNCKIGGFVLISINSSCVVVKNDTGKFCA